MSRLGFKSVVYDGASCLGELNTVPIKDQNFKFPNNEIRIHHLSPRSERCPPISVLQSISPFSVWCKLEPSSPVEQSPLISLHSSCYHELKTAVVLLGEEEIHLVAMLSKKKNYPCFWCYSVPGGLYNACLGMLNMRCLSIVFDLDETLIVANTMKSFEDRIETLRSWIARETDPVRILGMSAEMKRYAEDRAFLKQYTDTDSFVDNGKVYKVQGEEVSKVSEGQDHVVRPVIRLPEKNIVLTRINPEVRDTSVLVRLRPAWEDLRSYLIAKGRKRFEVYVCTMAERDYALEMWRLLDPGAHLIGSNQLSDRVVCVNSGSRKSLLNVFQNGNCHPKMAMVIDDRMKVWEDKDQPRVHVVPAFTPYYAPQAETANAVPVLCVARNVACNVRGGFFKEFDENLLQRISGIFYEDEVGSLPSAPDVSNYLMSEDASFVPYNNTNAPMPEGLNGPEVAQKLNPLDEKANINSARHPMTNNPEPRYDIPLQPIATASNSLGSASLRPPEKPGLLGAPFWRDINFSESDPEAKRRMLTMNHSQDSRYRGSGEPPLLSRLPGQEPPLLSRLPGQLLPIPMMQPQGGWLVEEDINKGRFSNQPSGADRQRARQNPLGHSTVRSVPMGFPSHMMEIKSEEAVNELQKQSFPPTTQPADTGNQSFSNSREVKTEGGTVSLVSSPSLYIGVLQEIGQRCNTKVEFRSVVSTSETLQFSVEVFFSGEKIGVGMAKTRRDAQQLAAENALRSLADKYISYVGSRSKAVGGDFDKLSPGNERGFLWDTINPDSNQLLNAGLTKENTSEVAERTPGNSSSNVVNQHVHKRASSPRLRDISSSGDARNGQAIA